MKTKTYPYRYIARLTIETTTPLAIGSGRQGLENERLIIRDFNDLPFIPGTSLAGVLRHELAQSGLSEKTLGELLGFQKLPEKIKENAQEKDKGQGSRLIISAGKLLANDGETIHDGLQEISWNQPYYASFDRLPERDHVKISQKGTAVDKAKFKDQLVFKGTRFVFELELIGSEEDLKYFQQMLDAFQRPEFRLGGGTRKGMGGFKIIELKSKTYNLSEDLDAYLEKSSELNDKFPPDETLKNLEYKASNCWEIFTLKLTPENFFFFGSGNVRLIPKPEKDKPNKKSWLDALPKSEQFFVWEGGEAKLPKNPAYLIPGTSLKGAIAHRVAFHYNKDSKKWIEKSSDFSSNKPGLDFNVNEELEKLLKTKKLDQIAEMNFPADSAEWKFLEEKIYNLSLEDIPKWMDLMNQAKRKKEDRSEENHPNVGENNEAVKTLFGYAKQSEKNDTGNANDEKEKGQRGRVIIPDIYLDERKTKTHIFTHVAIDRFTGGAIDGALFEEEVLYHKCESESESKRKSEIKFKIWVEDFDGLCPSVQKAFKKALDDLTTGKLQLGGNTSKGHGVFTGTYHPQIQLS